MKRILLLAALIGLGHVAQGAQAHENDVSISRQGDRLCFTSNGAPNHDIGRFPNRGNPHSFRKQRIHICVDATPKLTGRVTRNVASSGVSLTGIIFRPGTADFYDASGPRGFSRDPSSGWRLEGMGAADKLGMDRNNAHVDHRGLYHYHAPASALTASVKGSLIGYAADGFEIHFVGARAQSSWRLKPGKRKTPPYGHHDGTYEQDWQFVAGSGNLDECNGTVVDGRYVYFATDSFPFFPRCFKGRVSADFVRP